MYNKSMDKLTKEIINFFDKEKIEYSTRKLSEAYNYVIRNNRPFLTIPAKLKNREGILKLLLPNQQEHFKKTLLNENKSYKILSGLVNFNPKIYAGSPESICTSTKTSDLTYIFREKIIGKAAGNAFDYKTNSLNKKSVEKIVNTLIKFSEIDQGNFKPAEYFKKSQKTWSLKILKNLEKDSSLKTKQIMDFERLIKFSTIFFHKSKIKDVPIHGDLIPGNIIDNKDKVFLIDFEKTYSGSPFYDFASLYACFWNDSKMQNICYEILKRKFNNFDRQKTGFDFYLICHLAIIYNKKPKEKLLDVIRKETEWLN